MKLSEFYRSEEVFGGGSEETDNRQRYVVDLINSQSRPSVLLDFGCGTTFLKKKLVHNIDYFGCDIAETLVESDRIKKIIDEKIPFPDNAFDILYAGEVIEHLVDTDAFMVEVRRVLKKDGLLIITTPNLGCWLNRIMLLLGYQPYFTELSFMDKTLGRMPILKRYEMQKSGMGHLRIFTSKGLRDFVKLHGFAEISLKTVAIEFNPLYFALDKVFSYFGLGSDIVCVCHNKK
jgi:SAM-dependent methyltransferase